MPDRFEQKRDEMIKGGLSYREAQVSKLPEEAPRQPKTKEKAGK